MRNDSHAGSEAKSVRCAIYTRKSTEEGLEQAFNSLDAQREACAAYILSQRHEGWIEQSQLYDDGGFSGGTMERPALKKLLADVADRKVDVIVLYKVDRLTRSLADFARIVEVLDKAGASFVSVTQSFNTTTSMGRLTLNVLLSFAQFEREVTGERIRDKVAASKAKGMWMGGVAPLGYHVRDRKLIIDEQGAETVRLIFAQYIDLKSMVDLAAELLRRGIVSKQRVLSDGRSVGGRPFTRGALAHLLKNVVYVGEVAHKGRTYPGEHQPIIGRKLWDAVQSIIRSNRRERRTSARAVQPSVLAGMLYDSLGRPMSPSHAAKGTRRYRYYFSRVEPGDARRLWRIPALTIEKPVVQEIARLLGDANALTDELPPLSGEAAEFLRKCCAELGSRLVKMPGSELHQILGRAETLVSIHDDRLIVKIELQRLLQLALGPDRAASPVYVLNSGSVARTIPMMIKRRGQELKLIFAPSGATDAAAVDPKLVELVARAHKARTLLMKQTAKINPVERPHLARLARLSYLAPDIITAILDGRQPIDLTARALLRTARLPTSWADQRRLLGFGIRPSTALVSETSSTNAVSASAPT